jgi:UDP-N-acetylglucosamine--dolichyl-phosphate N-acetylglucosaminephosphotransferase
MCWTNRYPSRAFPGDTLCYVTGMAFAVVGIQAHFSKTLLLFFLPQIFNFVLSCPQLFGLVPCPRHRVPRYGPTYALRYFVLTCCSFDRDTHRLHPSRIQFLKRASRLSTVVLRVLAVLGCTELTTLPDGTILEATNLTLLNVLLLRFGPMHEKRLTQALIAVQVMLAVVSRV